MLLVSMRHSSSSRQPLQRHFNPTHYYIFKHLALKKEVQHTEIGNHILSSRRESVHLKDHRGAMLFQYFSTRAVRVRVGDGSSLLCALRASTKEPSTSPNRVTDVTGTLSVLYW